MDFISELRQPTAWYSKLAIIFLALAVFALLAVVTISGFMVYRMASPIRSHSGMNLQNFPGHPEALNFPVTGEGTLDGWFFPGFKSAPAIVLCPGYESSSAELVTLASALQEQHYNVLVFDFSAHGSTGGRSSLGYHEVTELRAALDAIATRGDVDAKRFGLWGANMGAYVALAEASNDARVRAVAAESPYEHPNAMVAILLRRAGLGSVPLVTFTSQKILSWLNPNSSGTLPLDKRIAKLSGVAQLYLQSPEEPILAAATSDLFHVSPPPHELVVLQHGNYAGLPDDDKHTYENRIVSFFLTNLPISGGN